MTPTPPQLDLPHVLTVLFAALLGPNLAVYIGPYAAIILGAIVGAALSLGAQPIMTKTGAITYFVLMSCVALFFTVPVADWLAPKLGIEDSRWLFAPVAALIGGVGRDWPKLVKWVGKRALRIIERKQGVGHED